ncbi:MAG: S41 family peptidase, partial [Calditrichota bacterium]
MKIVAFLLLFVITIPVHAELTQPERGAIWTTVWMEVRDHFAGFDSSEFTQWKGSFNEVLTELAQPPNDVEFWRSLRRQVATLNDGQTRIVIPDSLPIIYDTVPIRCMMIGEQVIVDRISSSPEVRKSGIEIGDELLGIDGTPALRKIVEDCVPDVSGSNREARSAQAVWRVLTDRAGTVAVLRLRKPSGKEYTAELTRWSGPDSKYYRELFAEDENRFDIFDDRWLYVSIGSQLTKQVQYSIMDHLKENPKISGLILDLRETRSGMVLADVIAKLVPFTVPMGPYRMRCDTVALTWESTEQTWIEADDEPWMGKIVALISPLTGGPAEQLLHPLVFANRVTLIGRATAGAGGQTKEVPLLSGGILSVTVGVPQWEEGVGLGLGFTPD